jgi:hypothetical protein
MVRNRSVITSNVKDTCRVVFVDCGRDLGTKVALKGKAARSLAALPLGLKIVLLFVLHDAGHMKNRGVTQSV